LSPEPTRYRTSLEDSARWDGFRFRPGDIVISTPSKSGTTWTQMICALLVFQSPELPAPLTTLSPWMDILVRPLGEVRAQLEAQRHRRFIKTHTPLDGLPRHPDVSYLVVGRDPRDIAVSLRHQGANLDRDVIRRLTGDASPAPDPRLGPSEREWFLGWMSAEMPPQQNLDTLRGVISQLGIAWARRGEPDVVLLHYADLSRDLEGEMRRLAARLGIVVPEASWPALAGAATFQRMRERAADRVPDERLGILKDPGRFFRSGASGEWRRFLSEEDLARYDARVASLAAPDLAQWLHHGCAPPPHPS
jgi:hypothetical protein